MPESETSEVIIWFLRTKTADLDPDIYHWLEEHEAIEINSILKELTTQELENLSVLLKWEKGRTVKRRLIPDYVGQVTPDLLERLKRLKSREDIFLRVLGEKGMLVNMPSQTPDDEFRRNFQRIRIKGLPISETIIKERR